MKPINIITFFTFFITPIAGCSQSDNNNFQGYIEGEYVYLASPKAGRLEKLLTERGKTVSTAIVLFELENNYERYVLLQAQEELNSASAQLLNMQTGKRPEEIAMAQAQLNQAKAEAVNASALLKRHENLIHSGGISRQELDKTRAQARSTAARVAELTNQISVFNLPERENLIEAQRATVKAAQSRVAQAQWELEKKQVQAPKKGLVYDTLFREGEWVPAGSPVIQLLPPGNVKIRFFIPETIVGKIGLGDQIEVWADGRTKPFFATISYVSSNAEFTPPIIYSNETRSKLVFMIEAQPEIDTALSLHPGQPVSVSLL